MEDKPKEEPRPILYGVSDYALMRRKNAWFVDRTAKIRDLEKVSYALFLRPRRFGKSLLCSILEAYYDVRYADRFDEFFAGTDIGANPTEERGRYLILRFDFSAVSKDVGKVQESFNKYAADCCDAFVTNYAALLPDGLEKNVRDERNAGDKLNKIAIGLRGSDHRLYVIIDEYDNFTNTILAESGIDAYNELCHGDGFFKDFFARLKAATSGMEATVTRLFITGVSPVTMDDVTSGFNIGTNISLRPQFADLTGFAHDDIHAIAAYYGETCGIDAERAERVCLDWFDNYRFGSFDAPPLANTTLVLWLFEQVVNGGSWPNSYIDENLRTDYAKIQHLIVADSKLNGNFHALETLVSEGALSEQLKRSFQAREIAVRENFVSLLYWMGVTTIVGDDMGTPVFGIPNGALRQISAQLFTQSYREVCGIDQRLPAVNAGMRRFAKTGEWEGILEPLLDVVRQNFAIRDAKEGETAVASAVSAILISAGGPYVVKREREANGGYYDISMAPRFEIAPAIAHAALIELKYLKPGAPAPTPEALAAIKAEATRQLDLYSADPALAAEWRLGQIENGKWKMENGEAASTLQLQEGYAPAAGGHVTLHRLVLVFHGGDCVLAEEV